MSRVEARSERVKHNLLVSREQACLSTAAFSLVWAAAIRSLPDIIRKHCKNRDFMSGGRAFYKRCWIGVGKELASTTRFQGFDDRGTKCQSLRDRYKCVIFFIVLLVWTSSILAFRYSFFLFLKYLLVLHVKLFRLFTLLWLGTFIHCILACFLWSKKPKHSPSNHGLCCFSSYSPRLSLAKVLEGWGWSAIDATCPDGGVQGHKNLYFRWIKYNLYGERSLNYWAK